jgi:spermidine/putrescine-binding protein
MVLAALVVFSHRCLAGELSAPASEKPEVLRLLVWGGYTPAHAVETFEAQMEAKYGRRIRLQISEVESNDDFFDPVREKRVDLITISHYLFKDERSHYIAKGLVLPPNLENIPNHALVMPELMQAESHTSDGVIYGVPLAMGPYGLAYNTGLVESEPTSWRIFWDSAFANTYVLGANEYIYNINITALALGYPREWIGSYDRLNNPEFKEKLRQLAVNARGFWVGVDRPKDLLNASLATAWGDSFSELQRQGEHWEMAAPEEGTPRWIDEYALTWALKNRPFMKQIAEEWINGSLSKEFQVDHLLREVQVYPVVTNIQDRMTPPEKERLKRQSTSIPQQTYSERDRNGLKLLWEEAMQGIDPERTEP